MSEYQTDVEAISHIYGEEILAGRNKRGQWPVEKASQTRKQLPWKRSGTLSILTAYLKRGKHV